VKRERYNASRLRAALQMTVFGRRCMRMTRSVYVPGASRRLDVEGGRSS
jgi:hypothetical protein